jgi:hypothetical protein
MWQSAVWSTKVNNINLKLFVFTCQREVLPAYVCFMFHVSCGHAVLRRKEERRTESLLGQH